MKRKIVLSIVALTATSAIATSTKLPAFPDVEYHWSRDYVTYLAENGVISGYEDGTFKPNKSVTREEASAMISRKIGTPNEKLEHKFKDVSGWSEKVIAHLQDLGIIVGVSEDKFEPTRDISRGEFATIIKRYVESSGLELKEVEPVTFEDISGHWAEDDIKTIAKYGIIEGVGKNKFAPNDQMTRGAVATMIARMDGVKGVTPEKPSIPDENENAGEIWNTPAKIQEFKLWWTKDIVARSQGNKLGKTYPDGWTAPKIQSKWSENHRRNQWILHNELGFNAPDPHTLAMAETEGRAVHFGGAWEGVLNEYNAPVPMPLRVIQNKPTSHEVMIQINQGESSRIPQSYRIPIVLEEVLKFYFGNEWKTVYDKTKAGMPEYMYVNGRHVTTGKQGGYNIYVDYPNSGKTKTEFLKQFEYLR